jgi:hypothetical protein
VNQLLSNGFRSGKLMNPKGAEKMMPYKDTAMHLLHTSFFMIT